MAQSSGLPWSEKVWKMKFFPGQEKVREFGFESGKLQKVREFKKFLKSNGLWQCINVLNEFEKVKSFPKVIWLSVSQNFIII